MPSPQSVHIKKLLDTSSFIHSVVSKTQHTLPQIDGVTPEQLKEILENIYSPAAGELLSSENQSEEYRKILAMFSFKHIKNPDFAINEVIKEPEKRAEVKRRLSQQFNTTWRSVFAEIQGNSDVDTKVLDADLTTTIQAMNEVMVYSEIKQTISEKIAEIYKNNHEAIKGELSKLWQEIQNGILKCHNTQDFINYIEKVLKNLNSQLPDGTCNFDEQVTAEIFDCVKGLFQYLCQKSPDNLLESGFKEAEQLRAKSLIDNFCYERRKDYAAEKEQLIKELRHQNHVTFARLDMDFCEQLNINPVLQLSLVDDVKAQNYQGYVTKLQTLLKPVMKSRTRRIVETQIELIKQLMALNNKLPPISANLNLNSNSHDAAPPVLLPPKPQASPVSPEQSAQEGVGVQDNIASTSSDKSNAPDNKPSGPAMEPIDAYGIQSRDRKDPPQLSQGVADSVSARNFLPVEVSQNSIAEYITELYKSHTNKTYQSGLKVQANIIDQWCYKWQFGKYNYLMTPDNIVANEILEGLKNRIIIELDSYLENRKNSFFIGLRDKWMRGARAEDTAKAREDLVNRIKSDLRKAKTPDDFKVFVKELNSHISSLKNTSTKLQPLLSGIQVLVSQNLMKMDWTLSIQYSNSDNRNAPYHAVNDRLKKRIASSLSEYKKDRTTTKDDSGFFGFFRAVKVNGIYNTIAERYLNRAALKTKHLAYADYFSSRIKKCETADDYSKIFIELSYVIKQLHQDNENGKYSAYLDEELAGQQKKILDNFLTLGLHPLLSEEHLFAMCAAVEVQDNRDNPFVKQMKRHLRKKYDNDKAAFSKKYDDALAIARAQERNKIQVTIKNISLNISADYSATTAEKAGIFRKYIATGVTKEIMASLVATSGKLTVVPGNLTKATEKMASVAELADLPGVGVVTSVVKKAVGLYDENKTAEEHKKIADTFESFKQVDKLCEAISKMLANRYLWQIGRIDASDITVVAEAAVCRIRDYISSGKFLADKIAELAKFEGERRSDVDLFVMAVSNSDIRHGLAPRLAKGISVIDDDNAGWTVEGVLEEPAIMIINNGKTEYCVKSGNTKPKYGFILGSAEEAVVHGFNTKLAENNLEYPGHKLHQDYVKLIRTRTNNGADAVLKVGKVEKQDQAQVINNLQKDVDHLTKAAKAKEEAEKAEKELQAKAKEEKRVIKAEAKRAEEQRRQEQLDQLFARLEKITHETNEKDAQIASLQATRESLLKRLEERLVSFSIQTSTLTADPRVDVAQLIREKAELAEGLQRVTKAVGELKENQGKDKVELESLREEIKRLRDENARLKIRSQDNIVRPS